MKAKSGAARPPYKMLKIGHRGASGHAPENTLTAFKKAMQLGADGIELDLHCCRSGEPVAMHDDTVERMTSGWGRVSEFTLAEIYRLRIKGGEHVPALDEVFDALGPDVCYFLECKQADAVEATAQAIMQRMKEGWPSEKLCLITFLHAPLAAALQQYPALYAGASFERMDEHSAAFTRKIGARAVLPGYRSLTQAHARQAHASGLKVIAWTVNAPDDIARMRALGVDGIISDYPERLADNAENRD